MKSLWEFLTYLWKFKKFPERLGDPRHMRILIYLKRNGPKTLKEISRDLGYPRDFTRRTLQLLRRMGAVEVFWKPGKGLEEFSS
ncbi:MAG: hypothetical protein DRN49_02135 [Thaumarchaeota archaeon]|nr:MAG: hypothetical protein DRN49_02135 [Nitrososphaerota archaeon]